MEKILNGKILWKSTWKLPRKRFEHYIFAADHKQYNEHCVMNMKQLKMFLGNSSPWISSDFILVYFFQNSCYKSILKTQKSDRELL